MKKLLSIIFFILLVTSLHGQQMEEHEQLTRQFIRHLESRQFTDAENMFSRQIEQVLSVDQLQEIWIGLLHRLGPLQAVEEVIFEDLGSSVIARARASFLKSRIILQLAFDRDKLISGINFRPIATEENYTLPDYANIDLYREEEMFLEVPQGQLPAIFTRPVFVDYYPLVILIPGSGPHDKDGTFGPNKPFKDLAIGLAGQGIATFRFDKKTRVYPKYFEEIKSRMTVEDEVLEDAATAIKIASRIKGVDRKNIYILGHSLGGMLAPRIAEENRRVDGIIIMSGNARPIEDVVLHQVEHLSSLEDGINFDRQDLNTMRIEARQLQRRDYTGIDPATGLLLNMPVAYWRDLSGYDQVSVAQELKEPVLVIQGGRDYQVPVEEFDLWQSALREKENSAFLFYPELNHLFLPGAGISTPDEYYFAGHVPENVILDISRWIKLDK